MSSIFLINDNSLNINLLIEENDIEEKRPSIGINENYKSAILGTKIQNNVATGDPICWEDVYNTKNMD